ncbi:MAG: ornithine cyclodeaminase family protein [Steroidobacteraceae bacterium]
MRLLRSKDLAGLLSPTELVAAVERAARAAVGHNAVVPRRQHFSFGDNSLLCMPAAWADRIGVKLVTVAPGNVARAEPLVTGVMIFNDAKSGHPLALLDAGQLTALRTGAVGALAIRETTPADLVRVGVIGAGVQAISHAIFATCVRSVRQLAFYARSHASAERFVAGVEGHLEGIELIRCASAHEVISNSELIITATNASKPVLPDDPRLLAGRHYLAVGSFKPQMRELPAGLFQHAQNIVVDSDAACEESGDLVGPLAESLLPKNAVIHLGELLEGRREIDRSGTTVAKTVGHALYDLAVAKALVEAAENTHVGLEFEM